MRVKKINEKKKNMIGVLVMRVSPRMLTPDRYYTKLMQYFLEKEKTVKR